MKLIVLLAVAGLSTAASLDNTYLPPSHAPSSGGAGIQAPGSNGYQPNSALTAPQGNQGNYAQNGYNPNQSAQEINDFAGYYDNQMPRERAQAAFERNAKILRYDNQNDGMNYAYAYETENGISADEQGVADWAHGVEAQGGFSYTGDDGKVYSIRYTAGLNGFVPQGDHLPTPPPIPEAIQRALEKNAMEEAAGVYDDGSYKEEQYSSGDHGYPSNGNSGSQGYPSNGNSGYNYNQPQNQVELVGDADTVVTNNALIRDSYQQPGFGNQGASRGPSNQGQFEPNQAHSGITQAYLPPVQRQSNQLGNRGFNQQPFGRQTQPTFNQGPSYGNQKPSFGNQGYSSQTPGNQGPRSQANRAYLPPFESQRSPSNQRLTNYQTPGFSKPMPRTQGTNNAYLPPK